MMWKSVLLSAAATIAVLSSTTLVSMAGASSAVSSSPAAGASASRNVHPTQYLLDLYELHTGERIDVVYRIGNHYLPGAIAKLDYVLRDYRTGTVKDYDLQELDLLHDLMARLGRPNGEIDIVCGYRTPHTNNWLREHSHGVALHSQHMQAKAIDIRVPGVPTAKVRDAALAMHRGGVGYYAKSNFVHVDVGPVRHW